MKKFTSLALCCFLLAGLCGTALAVEATYDNGYVTVTTESEGFFEILIDGSGVGRWVGTGMHSNTFARQLEDGLHTVRLFSADGDPSETNTFWVGEIPTEEPTEAPTEEPTAEPTEAPTEEPTDEPTEAPTEEPTDEPTEAPTEEPIEEPTEAPTEEPTDEPTEAPTEEPIEEPTEAPTEEPIEEPTEVPTEEPTAEPTEAPTEEPTAEPTKVPTPTPVPTPEPVPVPANAVQVKVEKAEIEPTCTKAGKASDGTGIPALGHRYMVASKTTLQVRYRCAVCGKTMQAELTEKVQNRLGAIVKDEKGAVLDYLGYSKKDDAAVYTIQVEKPKGIALLYLDYQVIAQLMREGYQQVLFINGKTELTISMNKISGKWFNTEDAVSTYIFQTGADNQGTTVVISGLTEKEQVFANVFDGVTLNGAPIEKNGTY